MSDRDEVRVVAGWAWEHYRPGRGEEFDTEPPRLAGDPNRPALLVVGSGLTAEQMRAALSDDPLDLETLSDEARREVVAFVDRLRAKHMPYAVASEVVVRRAVEAIEADDEYASPRACMDPLRAAVREMQRHDPRGNGRYMWAMEGTP